MECEQKACGVGHGSSTATGAGGVNQALPESALVAPGVWTGLILRG